MLQLKLYPHVELARKKGDITALLIVKLAMEQFGGSKEEQFRLTLTLDGRNPWTQWAAVSTHSGSTNELEHTRIGFQ